MDYLYAIKDGNITGVPDKLNNAEWKADKEARGFTVVKRPKLKGDLSGYLWDGENIVSNPNPSKPSTKEEIKAQNKATILSAFNSGDNEKIADALIKVFG